MQKLVKVVRHNMKKIPKIIKKNSKYKKKKSGWGTPCNRVLVLVPWVMLGVALSKSAVSIHLI